MSRFEIVSVIRSVEQSETGQVRVSTSLRMAMAETIILYVAIKSIKCLETRDRKESHIHGGVTAEL